MSQRSERIIGGVFLILAGGVATASASSTGASCVFDALPPGLRFELPAGTLSWLAVAAILALTIPARPLLSVRTLDALVLAGTCLLFAWRDAPDPPGGPGAESPRFLAYALLAAAAGYWVVRGVGLLGTRAPAPAAQNVNAVAATVFLAGALLIATGRLADAPLSDGSRDGLVGGLCLRETGKLPYGDAPGHEARSPLLYALHAALVDVNPPTMSFAGAPSRMTWSSRGAWIDRAWWLDTDVSAARHANMLLLLLVVAGLICLGARLTSLTAGLTMALLFVVFPGALECAERPEVMLPAALLTWSLAFALLPGVGGLASVVLGMAAGVAWPWAWLLTPALLAYFLRQGWNGVGATLGLLVGIAGALVGLAALTNPSVPRESGALAAAGRPPTEEAILTADGALQVAPREAAAAATKEWDALLWATLLDSEQLSVPGFGHTRFRQVAASGPARDRLQELYREASAALPESARLWIALRTVLEATWLPAQPPASAVEGAWAFWNAVTPNDALWTNVRRAAKLVCGVLSLVLAWALLRLRVAGPGQLVGALLALLAAALMTSSAGAATDWALLLPAVLAAFAVGGRAAPAKPPAAGPPPPGPAPRITIND